MKKYLVGNWKMVLNSQEGLNLLENSRTQIQNRDSNLEFWISAPGTHLPGLQALSKKINFNFGTQNIHWDKQGAFTGELSVSMAKEFGASFTLIGHSERRNIFNETLETVEKRFKGALGQELFPILCIGEKLEEREGGKTEEVLKTQLRLLNSVDSDKFLLAYEPVWAIGTGKTATKLEIEETHRFIYETLKPTHKQIGILYGGSVTPENFQDILSINHVAGGLVGGASCNLEKLMALLSVTPERGIKV